MIEWIEEKKETGQATLCIDHGKITVLSHDAGPNEKRFFYSGYILGKGYVSDRPLRAETMEEAK